MSPDTPAAFLAAWRDGDRTGMAELLDPDAVLVCDTGGVVDGPRDPVNGAVAIAEWMLARFDPSAHRLTPGIANTRAAVHVDRAGALVGTVVMRPDEQRLTTLWLTLNPEKLRASLSDGSAR
ncbi:hypothetical protein [Pseudolysinimonas sp.]